MRARVTQVVGQTEQASRIRKNRSKSISLASHNHARGPRDCPLNRQSLYADSATIHSLETSIIRGLPRRHAADLRHTLPDWITPILETSTERGSDPRSQRCMFGFGRQ